MLKELSNSRFLIPAMVILAVLATATGFYVSLQQSSHQQRPLSKQDLAIEGLFWPNPKQLLNFNMIDQMGNPFGLEQMKGKWSFVFFGYTHCPDVCPITMAVMADTYKKLLPEHNDVQVIFVSVDPERDSTEKLQQYVSYFDNTFIGLGGDSTMVDSLSKQIGVPYYLNNEVQTENYLVDHSASIFVLGPQVRLLGKLSAPHQSTKIIEQFTKMKEFINEQN